ncbi:hypothetical protein B7494_g2486 [Chlorociboria aeruginascens]|nr:hypothetical protein B7494_g2486 [Chlorociboria aeruginascens]
MVQLKQSGEDTENVSLEPIAIVGMGDIDSPSSFWEFLKEKKSGQTPKVPASRFNIDPYMHPNLERPGSFNVLGGYFLNGELEDFDPTFFNITPIEAMWLDPQQRKILEVSYEALESAGLTLDDVNDTNTGVFIGSFTSDYQQMSILEPDFRHSYAATGVDPGLISNRIGNVFNLRGPSFTINTACSSSIYAIHNACNALRARDCEAVIAGGVNLILTVDQHINTAKLGVLSPTGTCHTFDVTADGYGRAEGAGALYLKRLSDAIRDGDPVRGVIRSSAVNTNGKVEGMGITYPSVKGQERVVRAAYSRANMDPNKTAYAECHGTGTPVGDPVEVRAISNAMNDTRSLEKPLLVGAVKANIGHSEAASGIFAVMKAALMTEAGIIPGVCGLKNINPQIDEVALNLKVNKDTTPWPKDFALKRASVSSFGYGGTNGHVIVESIESLYPWYEHGKRKAESQYNNSTSRPLLVSLTAHDKTTLIRNINAHAKVASDFYLADLAYTLNNRRTKLAHKAYTIASESTLAESFALSSFTFGSAKKNSNPKLGFIFTGQGAQWAGMAVEAMDTFPSFHESIRELDQVLRRLIHAPSWSIEDILRTASPQIGEAEIAQPICTAIQIAIVDLFALWDIVPTVSVGHSSGEIGAAYAAGLVSAPEAIIAAFYRGLAVTKAAPVGTMLATGVGAEEILTHISDIPDVVVACENSPNSTTLSGTAAAIQATKSRLEHLNIFARELRTGKAYHSPQMGAVAPLYNELLYAAYQTLNQENLAWRQPKSRMISSLTGKEYLDDFIPIEYWSSNLLNRVQFNTAVTLLAQTPGLEDVTAMLEVGPHSALSGPFKQICTANQFDRFTYVPTFLRNANSATQLLKAAGELLLKGYAIDIEEVNAAPDFISGMQLKGKRGPRVLVDLPPYQWNYENKFWAEPRASHNARHLKYPRHDLLGSQIVGLSDSALAWRNVLRHKDVKWLKDHSLGGAAVFPAAGHMSLAIEALRQVSESEGIEVGSVTLRDLAITTALVVPDNEAGVEIQLRLQRPQGNKRDITWYPFTVESVVDGVWTTHCEGRIAANSSGSSPSTDMTSPVEVAKLTQRVPSKRWYDAFHRVGFQYAGTFQPLRQIRTNGELDHAAAHLDATAKLDEEESRYILHPSTIDACLQLIIISINSGHHKEMASGVVPILLEEISLWLPGDEASVESHAVAWTQEKDGRYFTASTKLQTPSGKVILDAKSLLCVSYEAAVPQNAPVARAAEPYMEVSWQPQDADVAATNGVPSEELTLIYFEKGSNFKGLVDVSSQQSVAVQAKHALDIDVSKLTKAVIFDIEGTILSSLNEQSFNALKAIISSGVPLIWLTAGVNQGISISGGMSQGFLRAIRSEQAAAKILLLDTDIDEDIKSVGNIVIKSLPLISTKDSGKDTEFWFHQGVLQVPRVVPNALLNENYAAIDRAAEDAILAPKTSLEGKVESGTLVFRHGKVTSQKLGSLEVEIQVHASEFQKADLQAGKERARLIVGTVLKVGSDVESSLVGKNVVTYAKTTFSTIVRVSRKIVTDAQNFSFSELAATLPGLTAAVNASITVAKIQQGEHILLLSPTSQFLAATIALSQVLKFNLTIVADTTAAKAEILADHNLSADDILLASNIEAIRIQSPHVVIANEFSTLAQEVWRNLPSASRFVLNDGIITENPDILPFTKGTSFLSTGVATLYKQNKDMLGELLGHSVDLLKQSSTLLARTSLVHDISVLKTLTNTPTLDNSVLQYIYGESEIMLLPSAPELQFSPDAAYLLVGCLGGLGRSLTTWMRSKGAKNFIFLSRSGADKPDAARVVDALLQSGATATVFRADASNEAEVAKVVAAVSATNTIKGVVHAAMVLQDGMFEAMTFDKFAAAVNPKMLGAINLHKALGSAALDFFVMTSSISAVLGNPAQTNYCAGNSFLDALAWNRNLNGLAATSIALPMVLDVGVVAENENIEKSLTRKGMYGIDEREMLRGFETAMLQPVPPIGSNPKIGNSQIILGLDPVPLSVAVASDKTTDPYWFSDARFDAIKVAVQGLLKSAGSGSAGGSFVSSLQDLLAEGPDAILKAISLHIMKRCSSILMLAVETFEYEGSSIASYGLDSMIGAELRNWLFKEFGLDMGFQTLLLPTMTFKSLSVVVAETLGLAL